jgi:fluoroquinolone transport system permease protein
LFINLINLLYKDENIKFLNTMTNSLTIIKTDLQNILRDYSLLMLLILPLIITGLLRWGYPFVLESWPVLDEYSPLLLGMLAMTSAAMPGLAISFAILDERDNMLLPALRVLPVAFQKIIINRNLAIYIFGIFAAFITIVFSGIADKNVVRSFLLALLTAAPAPILALVPAFFAANKIEGATLAKILNFLLIFPLPAFIFSGWWTNLLMVLPSWWVYKAFMVTGELQIFLSVAGIGIIFHAAIILLIQKLIFTRIISRT